MKDGLKPEELEQLDEVSRLTTEYPAWMSFFPSDRRPEETERFEEMRRSRE